MRFRVVEIDPRQDEPRLAWDTTFGFFPGDAHGDWALAGPGRRAAAHGLQAEAPIETAIALCPMTDARARPGDVPGHVGDDRGWWGDMIDVDEAKGEAPLGSRLWTLRWAPRDEETRLRAEEMAKEALDPLVKQRAIQGLQVRAVLPADAPDRLDIEINCYGATEASRQVARRFAILWESVRDGLPAALSR